MAGIVCYIKLERNTETESDDVFLKDVAGIRCADTEAAAKIKSIKVHHFNKMDKADGFSENRCVVSILRIIELIETACPGVTVESLGEADVLIERVTAGGKKGAARVWKIALVAAISFFGTAFTIMAYHNDIGITDVFAQIHRIVMGSEPEGISALEVSYSAGLALGIILFFNHIGARRLTKDPTPIEVEMRIYEKDVNDTLIETADREGRTIDAK